MTDQTARPSGQRLTLTEARLLTVLSDQPRQKTRYGELVELVLEGAVVLERTIDVHIKGLRKKLGPAGRQIETVRGAGYRFAP
jgi:two-component system, OmpR family, phosphate regulon response regulator PhoB